MKSTARAPPSACAPSTTTIRSIAGTRALRRDRVLEHRPPVERRPAASAPIRTGCPPPRPGSGRRSRRRHLVDPPAARSRSRPPSRPWRAATTSARIDSAVSSLPIAPRSRPTGADSRSSSSSSSPAASSRSRRAACARREPIAPTNRAGERSATVSAASSSLGSWVSTTIDVAGSIPPSRSNASSGHATMTSTASGNRSLGREPRRAGRPRRDASPRRARACTAAPRCRRRRTGSAWAAARPRR